MDSSTGGTLDPALPFPLADDPLDHVFQSLITSLTGIDGSLVRPRWQITNPKQPEASIDWCAMAVIQVIADAGPSIVHTSLLNGYDTYIRHEALDVLTSFYGPNAQTLSSRLRDGLAIPQNTDVLLAVDARWIGCGAMRSVPELINQQWVMRIDMTCSFRRKITRVYGIRNILGSSIHLFDDTIVDDTITVVPPP